ncbi:hypothetical protein KPH14_002055 [Odynerus spinipes]|uniref:Uncharacterized protein n=1 Tax=Odynerus spinipes TaxID=1348599 RepID=A0AAD9VLU0_9HYME|nr:hypothetical protein KPH14_002055 [Odynerus spinipes]
MNTEEKPTNKSPEESANIFSILFFWWTKDFFRKGVKGTLILEDIYDPLKSDESEGLAESLEREWYHELEKVKKVEYTLGEDGNKQSNKHIKPSLYNAILRVFWKRYFVISIFIFIHTVVLATWQPILQGWIIDYFNVTPNSKHVTKEEAITYASCLILDIVLSIFICHHTNLRNQEVGMQIRIACSSLVYRKILRLSKATLTHATGAGTIINILSNDMSRFDTVTLYLHYIWIIPIQLVIMTYIMWRMIGVPTFVGILCLLLISFPSQGLFPIICKRLRASIASLTDKRVQLMNDFINGIQVIKMYAWEKPFSKFVSKTRKTEVHKIKISSFVRTEFLLLDEAITSDQPIMSKPKSNKQEKNGLKNCSIILKRDESTTEAEAEKPASVELTRVSANWIPHTLPPTLCNISMKVEAGQLCILLGQVGAGKSALLHVLLKELPLGAGTMTIYQNSSTKIQSQMDQKYVTDNPDIRISYASQETWLFSGTIRQNILFGQPYDKKRYMDVTRVCALNKDFQQLPQGDMSIVGERGVMLSGGQRARVNLARAVYKQAEIYLLDDPLSAVDAKVARHIFKKCIAEYLNGKTRILATHQLQFLKSANVIVALDHGTIRMKGSYNELLENNEEFVKMIIRIKTDREQIKRTEETKEKPFGYNRESIRSRMSIKSNDSSVMEPEFDDYKAADNDEQEEAMITGDISWKIYKKFFKHGGSWPTLVALATLMILGQIATSGNDYWVSYWTNLEVIRKVNNRSSIINNRDEYSTMINNTFFSSFLSLDEAGLLSTNSAIYVYTFCILSCIVFVLARSIFFVEVCMNASQHIHDTMFNNVLQANMRFFHMNPSGRILNRFSKDVGAMDELLPRPMIETIQIVLVVGGIICIEIITNYWILFPLIVLGACVLLVRRLYIITAQRIKRLEGVCKSPVFCHVSTTLNGLSTIRSCGKETRNLLRKEFDRLQDRHTGTWYLLLAASSVLGFLLDIFSCLFIAFITFYFILEHTDNTLGGDVGLAISQALIIINTLQHGVKQSVEMFTQMASVERIFQYTDLPKETFLTKANPAPSTWPSQGRLVLNNVSMRYNQNDQPVLKNLTITIEAGWKVGVVGRTGAGKSSLISALFRLFADGLEGEIKIDDIDTSTIDLQELRSRISIIPQEPILFAASLRYNLDPNNQYNDATLWDVLREVELTDIGLDQKIVTNGNNLSVGQRQLICLARAILRKNRVIVLDEATANIDSYTDELIQRTLRIKFADCTVLTIAHRLNTIIDSNRILVMDAGQIAEFGSPYELLNDKPTGLFSQMVKNTGRVMSKTLLQQAEIAYRQNSMQCNHELSLESLSENDVISCVNEEYII